MGATDPTKYADLQTVAALLDSSIGEVFRSAAIMPNLMHLVDFGPGRGTDSTKLVYENSLAATTATEATDHTVDNYTQSSPNTLAVAEVKVYVEVSDKAKKFGRLGTPARILREAGRACAEKFDTDAIALFDGFSTDVGTGGQDNSPAILAEAAYKADAADAPGERVYVLHSKQIWDVKEDIVASSATVWTNPQFLSLMSGRPAANGYKGTFFDLPVFMSNNVAKINSDVDYAGALLDAENSLAAMFGSDVEVDAGRNVKKGVDEYGITLWYDVKEYRDETGIKIVSKVA